MVTLFNHILLGSSSSRYRLKGEKMEYIYKAKDGKEVKLDNEGDIYVNGDYDHHTNSYNAAMHIGPRLGEYWEKRLKRSHQSPSMKHDDVSLMVTKARLIERFPKARGFVITIGGTCDSYSNIEQLEELQVSGEVFSGPPTIIPLFIGHRYLHRYNYGERDNSGNDNWVETESSQEWI